MLKNVEIFFRLTFENTQKLNYIPGVKTFQLEIVQIVIYFESDFYPNEMWGLGTVIRNRSE